MSFHQNPAFAVATNSNVLGTVVMKGTSWGPVVLLDQLLGWGAMDTLESVDLSSRNPHIGVDGQGRVIATWHLGEASRLESRVRAAIFE